jgi:hypothetical protein
MTEKDFFDRFAYDPKKDVLGTGALGTKTDLLPLK